SFEAEGASTPTHRACRGSARRQCPMMILAPALVVSLLLEAPAQPEAHAHTVGIGGLPVGDAGRRILHVATDFAGVEERLAEQARAARERERHASPRLPAPAAEGGVVVSAGLEVG